MIGPTWCRRYSKQVITPKFPLPPRTPQKSSGFSSSLARTTRAVGRHQLDGEEVVRGQPALALEPAAAAPERQPRDPGRREAAAGHRQAVLLGGGVELAPRHPGLRAGGPRPRVDVDRVHLREVDTRPSSQVPCPAAEWPAAADRDLEPALAREVTAATTSSTLRQRAISAGWRSNMPFHTILASS